MTISWEQLQDWENVWRSRLDGRSLVLEADIAPEEARDALEALGKYFRNSASNAERAHLTYRYRAVLLAGMCAVASTNYEAGTYWRFLPSGFGTSNDPNRQHELAEAFRRALKAMRLARFTTPLRNVGEILMHSGVPLQSVRRLVHTLLVWDSQHPLGQRQAFVTWAATMPQALAVTRGFDVPTWRFIAEGGEIAEDFIDRVFEAISGGTENVGLPSRVLEGVRDALTQSPRVREDFGRRADIESLPTVRYDAGRGVDVQLPPLEHAVETALSWTVTAGGSRERVDVPAPWPGDAVTPRWVRLRTPQQRVHVSVLPGPQEWAIELFNPAEPMMIFDGVSGALIPPRNSIPKGRVWMAIPNPDGIDVHELVEASGSFSLLAYEDTPRGWEGWSFISSDVSALEKVRLKGFGERWRYVSTVDRPRLGIAPRLEYIQTLDGSQVLGMRPRLLLPGPGSGAGTSWTWIVSVNDAAGSYPVTDTFEVGPGGDEVDPWRSVAGPLLGEFTVTVRGSLGRGATLRTAVAEGVSVAASTPFRWMDKSGAGLETATVTLRSERAESETEPIKLESTSTEAATILRAGASQLRLMVCIPYLSVGLTGAQDHESSIVPVWVDNESLGGSIINLTVPPSAGRVTMDATVGTQVVQTVDAKGAPSSTNRTINLAALADTMAQQRSAVLRIRLDGREATVAYTRPRRLASGACVTEDGVLKLSDAAPIEGLVAYVYPRFAPWRPPTRVAFPAGTTSIPLSEEIRAEGEATIVLAIENPWVPATPPPHPDMYSGNVFRIEVGSLADLHRGTEQGFRSWLAGASECPSHPQGLPLALKIYSFLGWCVPYERVDHMRADLAAAVRANRTALMEAVLETGVDLQDIMRLLIEADVVTVPSEDWESSPALWTFSPSLGVIADSDEIGGPADSEFEENVLRFLGDSGGQILRYGRDPEAGRGRFGASYDWLCRQSDQHIDDLWRAVSIIPKALLDESSRTSAAYQLFRNRGAKRLRRTVEGSEQILSAANAALKHTYGSQANEPIAHRSFRPGWGNLPAVSLAFALIARGTARGRTKCIDVFEVVRDEYARLAAAAPAIVEQDLGLAELWITRWENAG